MFLAYRVILFIKEVVLKKTASFFLQAPRRFIYPGLKPGARVGAVSRISFFDFVFLKIRHGAKAPQQLSSIFLFKEECYRDFSPFTTIATELLLKVFGKPLEKFFFYFSKLPGFSVAPGFNPGQGLALFQLFSFF